MDGGIRKRIQLYEILYFNRTSSSINYHLIEKTILMAVSATRVMMQFDEVLISEAGGCPEDDGCDD